MSKKEMAQEIREILDDLDDGFEFCMSKGMLGYEIDSSINEVLKKLLNDYYEQMKKSM